MNLKPKGGNISIDEVLTEIDQRSFIQTLNVIVSEISPGIDTQYIATVTRRAIRCACLLDLYTETSDNVYLIELKKQRSRFYKEVPKKFHSKLYKVENNVINFFNNERTLTKRIVASDKFSEDDIKKYLLGKSSDNLFYGKLLELLVPEWNLTRELQIQTMLFDMGKDLVDYEEDVTNGLPNILIMCINSKINKNKISQLAQELKNEALASKNINVSPSLVKAIKSNYKLIKERLECKY